jgi:IclR family acetate operon transcriptional repressor
MAKSQPPRSLNRLMQTFELLAEDTDGLTLSQLARALAAPKTSLLNLLPALTESGYLEQTDGRYNLGPRMFALSGTVVRRRQFTLFARPSLAHLVEDVGETASLAVIDRTSDVAVYVDSIASRSAINYTVPIGQIRPLYASVAGKVLLAYQSKDYIAQYLKRTPLIPRTTRTITSKTRLAKELTEIRRNGWAGTVEESSEGVSGFASPIFDREGQVIAAISIGGPAKRVFDKRERCRTAVQEAAAEVSRMMGHVLTT